METKDLMRLKEEIEKKKIEKAELQGKLNSLMETLKNDWNCKSIEEAEKLLREMKDNLSKMEKDLQDGLKELEEKYYD